MFSLLKKKVVQKVRSLQTETTMSNLSKVSYLKVFKEVCFRNMLLFL